MKKNFFLIRKKKYHSVLVAYNSINVDTSYGGRMGPNLSKNNALYSSFFFFLKNV